MPASYRTDDGRFEVMRPLIECAERDIAAFAAELAFPIIPCKLCGSQEGCKRDAMTPLIDTLERDHPHVRAVMANALRNVGPATCSIATSSARGPSAPPRSARRRSRRGRVTPPPSRCSAAVACACCSYSQNAL